MNVNDAAGFFSIFIGGEKNKLNTLRIQMPGTPQDRQDHFKSKLQLFNQSKTLGPI